MRTDLVVRAQRGDREAFDVLATALYDRLYSVGRRILRDGHAAEDAVQEALIRGWRDLRSLREPDRFEAWMHRLLVNACHDLSRRGRRFEVQVPVTSRQRRLGCSTRVLNGHGGASANAAGAPTLCA